MLWRSDVKLFHTTPLADLILAGGFEDRSYIDSRETQEQRRGVWFSDAPVEVEYEPPPPGGTEARTLVVELPDEVAARYLVETRYLGEEEASWREYLIPAEVANGYPARIA
jgi:hypothetical protein